MRTIGSVSELGEVTLLENLEDLPRGTMIIAFKGEAVDYEEVKLRVGQYLTNELPTVAEDVDWHDGRYMEQLVDGIFASFSEIAAVVPAPSVSEVLDDAAVDAFAAAMKKKLAEARAKGRRGWNDKTLCTDEYLSELLIQHLDKGNRGTFEDIANFAMMIHQRGADPKVLMNVVHDAAVEDHKDLYAALGAKDFALTETLQKVANLEATIESHDRLRRKMKEQAGFSLYTSFDVVGAEVVEYWNQRKKD